MNDNVSFTDYGFGMRHPNCSKLVQVGKMAMTLEVAGTTSSSYFFDVGLFLLSILVTGQSFMLISSLVLEL